MVLPLIVPSKWKGLTCPLSRSEVKNSKHGINCFTFYNNWCQRLLEITIIYFLHGGDFAPSQLILAEGIGWRKKGKLSGWNSCSISANHFALVSSIHTIRESLMNGTKAICLMASMLLWNAHKRPHKAISKRFRSLWMESKIFHHNNGKCERIERNALFVCNVIAPRNGGRDAFRRVGLGFRAK